MMLFDFSLFGLSLAAAADEAVKLGQLGGALEVCGTGLAVAVDNGTDEDGPHIDRGIHVPIPCPVAARTLASAMEGDRLLFVDIDARIKWHE